MSSKRMSTGSKFEKITIDCSDLSQQHYTAKRETPVSLIDTKLQDLPNELLEDILIKAVVIEVKSMKLLKKVWSVKAYHVMDRLRTVCLRWSCVLATNLCRNKIYEILEKTAQKQIRLELVQYSSLKVFALDVTTMNGEVFVLGRKTLGDFYINVYDRNHMRIRKGVLSLPVKNPLNLAASDVSNCLYLLKGKAQNQVSVLRICRGNDNKFNILSLMSNLWLPNPTLTVTTTGDLILSRQQQGDLVVLWTFDANSFMKRAVTLSPDISNLSQIIPKSNGNLVLVSLGRGEYKTMLTEIDQHGTILRQYRPSVRGSVSVSRADVDGRLVITERGSTKVLLVDSEFNVISFIGPQLEANNINFPYDVLHYNCKTNEIIRFFDDNLLCFFCLTEE